MSPDQPDALTAEGQPEAPVREFESADAVADDEPANPASADQSPLSARKIGSAILVLAVLMYLSFVLVRLVMPARWAFSIEARSQVVEIELPTSAEMQRQSAETRWLIDGAVLCSHEDLDLRDEWRLKQSTDCGSRRWVTWRIPAGSPEQVLRLNGGAVATLHVPPERGLAMSLRRDDQDSLGSFSVVGVIDDARLGAALNLIWPEVPSRSLTLPFSGAISIGRTASWSGTRMLLEGTAVVYTADESADQRTAVDSARLMLGDQVRLGPPEPTRPWPKGFVRIGAGDDAMRVVAFGRAPGLRIERFGESGYGFRPGPVRKLATDPQVAFWGSILVVYVTLFAALHPFIGNNGGAGRAAGLLLQFKLWLRQRRRE